MPGSGRTAAHLCPAAGRSGSKLPGTAVVAAVLVAGIITGNLSVPPSALGKVYGGNGQRGWWWYEDPPRQESRTEEKALSRMPVYSPEEMAKMDTDRLRQYADQALKEAVREPSEANVRNYYIVQDVIRRKALAFTNASELVWQKYPELSVAKDSPLAAPGRKAMTRERVEERERVLEEGRRDFALLYFTSEGCPFCQEQEGILSYFRERFDWKIKPIDVDRNPALASRFGIVTTPSLLLIHRGSKEYLPVTAGVASAYEIEAKLYRGIRLMRGEVSPENFNIYDFQKGGGFDVEAGR